MSKSLCLIDWLLSLLQGPWVYIYTLLKEIQPDTTRTRIPNETESVYKTIQITKENIKLSSRDKLGHHHRPIGNLQVFLPHHRQALHRSYRQRSTLTTSINTSPPMDLATFSRLLIGNHPHRQLSCRPVTVALSCRSTLYRSWVRVQKTVSTRTHTTGRASALSVRWVFLREKTLPWLLQIPHRRNRTHTPLNRRKNHLLCKCANTNECPPPKCMCVSFSQIISPKELS